MNGVKLQDATDFSAADGNTVNLTSTAVTGDVLELVAFKALTLGASNIGITSAGTEIVSSGVQTLNFIGAAVTALGTGDVGGAKTAVVTVNKTVTIGTRAGVQNLNVTSGIATIGLRTTTDPSGIGTIRF